MRRIQNKKKQVLELIYVKTVTTRILKNKTQKKHHTNKNTEKAGKNE